MSTETKPAKPAAISLSSVEIKLDQVSVPKNYVNRGRQWVLQGSKHDFMPRVLGLIRRSPTASAVTARIASLTAGDGFRVNPAAGQALVDFLKNVARTGPHRTGDKLLKRVVKDLKVRAFAIQVVWAKDGLHIAELHHQRIETVAVGLPDDEDNITTYWLCRDWSQQGKYPPRSLPAYNPANAATEPVQLFVYADEDAGVEFYAPLDYEAALPYMEVEGNLATHHSTEVASGFAAKTAIMINKGPEATEDGQGNALTAENQRQKLETKFKEKYTGPGAQRLMFMWGDGSADSAEKMAKIVNLPAGSPEMYEAYASLAQQAILSAFQCTSPMVAGLPSANGGALGGNGQELYQSFKLFFNTRCLPDQDILIECFRELFSRVAGVDFSKEPEEEPWLNIHGSLPVEYTFSEQLMELIMTDDELRAKIDLKPLPAGAKTAADPPALPATGAPVVHPPAAPPAA
ncbi:MAG: hypothetical protein ACRYFK_14320 [Janthinobacterium lividum]